MAAATALQQALSQVGIKTTLHGYPTGTYYANFAGVPKYVHQHDLGIAFGGWAPDWPDGYGFFDFITAGDTISPAGNYNVEELNDPVVNNDLRQDGRHQQRRDAQRLHQPDRHAGDEGRGDPARGVRQVAALPLARS